MHTYIFSILIASVIISQSGCANPCPDGILSKADNNTCYAIVETPMSAKDAEIACNFYPLGSNCANGHAASISSAFENTDIYNYIKSLTSKNVWLGAAIIHDSELGYYFQWTDGTDYTYTNFKDSGMASNNTGVLFNTRTGKWTVANGEDLNYGVCKYTPEPNCDLKK